MAQDQTSYPEYNLRICRTLFGTDDSDWSVMKYLLRPDQIFNDMHQRSKTNDSDYSICY